MSIGGAFNIIGIGPEGVYKSKAGASIDAQALQHFTRVIADGGVVPSGLSGVNAFFKTIKTIYGTSDITTAISVGLDAQVLGYKLGAGAGTTLGQAAQKLYSCSGASGDVVQTTAASQPLLLVHEGANYYTTINTNNNCTTTTNAMTSMGNNFFVKTKIATKSISTCNTQIITTQCANNGISISIINGKVRVTNTGGFYSFDQISLIGEISDNVIYWLKFTGTATEFKIEKSIDNITYSTIATVTPTTSNFTPTSFTSFTIGNISLASILNIYSLELSQTEISSILYSFNPNQYNAATSQTQWTSSTGEVWTINTGTAATGYKGVLVDRTIMQGDKVDDSMTSGTLSSRQFFTSYSANRFFTYTGNQVVYSGSTNSHLLYTGVSAQTAFNGTNLGSVNTSLVTTLATIDFNSTNSKIRINSGADTVGDSGTQTSNSLRLFVYGSTNFGNTNLNTLIQTRSINTDAQKTAMYNYIRSINRNSF